MSTCTVSVKLCSFSARISICVGLRCAYAPLRHWGRRVLSESVRAGLSPLMSWMACPSIVRMVGCSGSACEEVTVAEKAGALILALKC